MFFILKSTIRNPLPLISASLHAFLHLLQAAYVGDALALGEEAVLGGLQRGVEGALVAGLVEIEVGGGLVLPGLQLLGELE
jgi:hypothetical protein